MNVRWFMALERLAFVADEAFQGHSLLVFFLCLALFLLLNLLFFSILSLYHFIMFISRSSPMSFTWTLRRYLHLLSAIWSLRSFQSRVLNFCFFFFNLLPFFLSGPWLVMHMWPITKWAFILSLFFFKQFFLSKSSKTKYYPFYLCKWCYFKTAQKLKT